MVRNSFCLFKYLFAPLATFEIFWDRPFEQTGQYGCLQCWSNHVPTKKLEVSGTKAYLAYFLYNTLAYFGFFCHLWSQFGLFFKILTQKSNMFCTDAFCSVSRLFVPTLPTQYRSSWPICMAKPLFLAYFDAFWQPQAIFGALLVLAIGQTSRPEWL